MLTEKPKSWVKSRGGKKINAGFKPNWTMKSCKLLGMALN